MVNQETLLDKSLRKMTEKLDEEIEKNKWMEMELMLMENSSPIGEEDLNDDAKEKVNSINVLKKFKGLSQTKKEKNMLKHETLLVKILRKMTEKLDEEIKKNKWMEVELSSWRICH
ncbi:hypothetical protein LINPERHAP2_LOCUS7221 [Linum perenne]